MAISRNQRKEKLNQDLIDFLKKQTIPVTFRPLMPRIPGNEGFEIVTGWGTDVRSVVAQGTTMEQAISNLVAGVRP